MTAREEQHVALDRAHAAHHVIGAGAHLIRRFPTGAAVAENLPVGAFGVDFGAGATFVVAVVTFDQIAIDLGAFCPCCAVPVGGTAA